MVLNHLYDIISILKQCKGKYSFSPLFLITCDIKRNMAEILKGMKTIVFLLWFHR